jgi:amidase
MTSHLDPIDQLRSHHQSDLTTIGDTIAKSQHAMDAAESTNAIVWRDDAFTKAEVARATTSARARMIDSDISETMPLLGLAVSIKELDSPIAGTPNSWGNKQLKDEGYVDTHTATSVEHLRNAGAIVVGKTNNPELALTVTTDSVAHGPCNNPLDPTHNAGGSSGGAAASVASGMVSVAMCGDGGGSTRIPAACCGVYGMKPSRGIISAGPIISEAWAGLASKGIIARRVDDLATVLDVVSAPDLGAQYNAVHTVSYRNSLELPLSPLRIGVRTKGFGDMYDIDTHIVHAVNKVVSFLSDAGHVVEESSPVSYDDASITSAFSTIIAAHTVHDIDEVRRRCRDPFSIEKCESVTQFFWNEGQRLSIVDYLDARFAMETFTRRTAQWFSQFDVLITPTIARVAPLHGEVESDLENAPYLYSGLCMPANFAGLPAITVPIATKHETGLPAGLQIVAQRDHDATVLQLAKALETDYSDIYITQQGPITNQ